MSDDSTEVQAEPVAQASAESSNGEIIDRWLSIEFPGTVFADTPEKWNDLRKKVGNLKTMLKIKE